MLSLKNKILIKLISLVLAQAFLLTGPVYPEYSNKNTSSIYIYDKTLRVPMAFGKKEEGSFTQRFNKAVVKTIGSLFKGRLEKDDNPEVPEEAIYAPRPQEPSVELLDTYIKYLKEPKLQLYSLNAIEAILADREKKLKGKAFEGFWIIYYISNSIVDLIGNDKALNKAIDILEHQLYRRVISKYKHGDTIMHWADIMLRRDLEKWRKIPNWSYLIDFLKFRAESGDFKAGIILATFDTMDTPQLLPYTGAGNTSIHDALNKARKKIEQKEFAAAKDLLSVLLSDLRSAQKADSIEELMARWGGPVDLLINDIPKAIKDAENLLEQIEFDAAKDIAKELIDELDLTIINKQLKEEHPDLNILGEQIKKLMDVIRTIAPQSPVLQATLAQYDNPASLVDPLIDMNMALDSLINRQKPKNQQLQQKEDKKHFIKLMGKQVERIELIILTITQLFNSDFKQLLEKRVAKEVVVELLNHIEGPFDKHVAEEAMVELVSGLAPTLERIENALNQSHPDKNALDQFHPDIGILTGDDVKPNKLIETIRQTTAKSHVLQTTLAAVDSPASLVEQLVDMKVQLGRIKNNPKETEPFNKLKACIGHIETIILTTKKLLDSNIDWFLKKPDTKAIVVELFNHIYEVQMEEPFTGSGAATLLNNRTRTDL